MIHELNKYYGSQFELALIEEINSVATFVEMPAGQDVMKPGQYMRSMPLLISGSIKIMRPDDHGDELLLYHLERGSICAMTMTCCTGNTKSEIHAVTETPVKLLMIPVSKMEEWSSKYKTWRNFVFQSYHDRLNEMLHTIDSIAFDNMDKRLLNYIKDKVRINKSNILKNTHQEIAYELHSSRVVISRLLKKLENIGKIKLHRNYVEIINLD